jgi:hypothetical protein
MNVGTRPEEGNEPLDPEPLRRSRLRGRLHQPVRVEKDPRAALLVAC